MSTPRQSSTSPRGSIAHEEWIIATVLIGLLLLIGSLRMDSAMSGPQAASLPSHTAPPSQ